MATRTTNNQNQVTPQTVSEQVILSPEEYQMVLNSRQQAQAPVQQQPVQQVAPQPTPIPQAAPQIQQPVQQAPTAQTQAPTSADPKAEKKAKFLKAGKTVLKTTAIAGAGAAVATAVFLLTKNDDAAEDAAEGAAAFVGSLFI